MKIGISVCYFLFSIFSVFGQDYISYHQRVIIAEQAILDSNYAEAVDIYDSLFNRYDFVFANDCYTATQTAIVDKQFDKAFSFIGRGFKQGLKIEIIDEDSILVELKNHSQWEEMVNKYDSLRNIYINNVDWNLRACIDSLNDLDQKLRDKHELHPWNFLWRPFIWWKWCSVTKHIVEDTLFQIIKEKGYPAEKLIGLDEKWMHYKIKRDSKRSFFACTILIHYYSKPRKFEINKLLEEEIRKGNITPDQYASIIDFQAEWGKEKYYKVLYYNQTQKTNDTTLFLTINKNRYNIGLESIDAWEKKWQRGLYICKSLNEGNYKHIKLFATRCDD
jgi:hypothetical protein